MTTSAKHSSIVFEGFSLYTRGWKAQALLYIGTFAASIAAALIADLGFGLDERRVVQFTLLAAILLLLVIPPIFVIAERLVLRSDSKRLNSALNAPRRDATQATLRARTRLARQIVMESKQWVTALESEAVYIDTGLQLNEYVVQESDFMITSDLEQ